MSFFLGFIAGAAIVSLCWIVWMMKAMAEGEIYELDKMPSGNDCDAHEKLEGEAGSHPERRKNGKG